MSFFQIGKASAQMVLGQWEGIWGLRRCGVVAFNLDDLVFMITPDVQSPLLCRPTSFVQAASLQAMTLGEHDCRSFGLSRTFQDFPELF